MFYGITSKDKKKKFFFFLLHLSVFFSVKEAHPDISYFAFNKVSMRIKDMERFFMCDNALFKLKGDYKIKHCFSSLNNLIDAINMILNTSNRYTFENNESCLLVYHTFEKPAIIIEDKRKNELFGNFNFIICLEEYESSVKIGGFGVEADGWINLKNNSNIAEPLQCFLKYNETDGIPKLYSLLKDLKLEEVKPVQRS